MSRAKYVAANSGLEIELDSTSSLMVGTAAELRGHAWSYTKMTTSISNAQIAELTDAQINLIVINRSSLDLLRRNADIDIYNATPGTLVIDSVWMRRCYLTDFSYSSITPEYIVAKAKVVFIDNCWWRERKIVALPQSGSDGINALDYPHDYPHDYAPSVNTLQVINESALPSSIRLTIYGPATNPQINIGGNVYRANCAVPSGSRLVIDTTSDPKSIVLIDNIGSSFNKFSSGVRGTGVGSGSYIFEQLKPGLSDIAWDGSFGFDLIWQERESEVPWTSS